MVMLDAFGPSEWDEQLPDLMVLRWACLRRGGDMHLHMHMCIWIFTFQDISLFFSSGVFKCTQIYTRNHEHEIYGQ